MVLELNSIRQPYREFEGIGCIELPKLIADGRVLMSVAELMERRIQFKDSNSLINHSYLDNYFGTGDAIAYNPKGKVKVVLDCPTLMDIPSIKKANKIMISDTLNLTNEEYNGLKGEEFKKGELGKIESSLSREEVKAHPI
jgi:hypothetical protein